MSKANQKFVQADEAVSPVIGVILMVAITVVLAAVVFVLVSNLSKTSDKAEEAATTSRSPSTGVLEITMVKVGDHGPYNFTADSTDPNYAVISVNGVECDPANAASTFPTAWGAGGVVRLPGPDSTAAGSGDCLDEILMGESVSVNVPVAGTLIQSTTVDIRT
jgi:flagellin-like protein